MQEVILVAWFNGGDFPLILRGGSYTSPLLLDFAGARKMGHSHASLGTISTIDADGKLRIYTPAGSKAWMWDPSEVELVEEEELHIGDWVRVKASVSTPTHQWGEVSRLSVGVVHCMENEELWASALQGIGNRTAAAFKVRIREGLVTPQWGWGMETHASKGQFRWREGRPWIGDPADVALDKST
ncbi:unnamed protein product [Prunus armeniaca]|uniref:Mind bomb SH3 repeat domain-containing protein n=1 Tax=Prunus armeniaca TaxID=36596 RepID=A0A6J5WGC7_PRUAR|nr:unnamed protein product [Prunus armeniaca]CAB4298692.1 unnamed protein product [Prunus armeniaca]